MSVSLFSEIREGESGRQVIFFPYLGGSASAFNGLIDKLGGHMNIWVANPPGHGSSKLEPVEDIDVLTDMYYKEIIKIITPGCILFGHSMGGVIAYYLTQRIMGSRDVSAGLRALVLSACAVPRSMRHEKNSLLPDSELLEKLAAYGAISKEVIRETGLLEFFLPVFRADYKILESAALKEPDAAIDIPTFLVWGENDSVQPVDSLGQWLPYVKNRVTVLPIKEGEHLFIDSRASEVAEYIEKISDGTLI